MTYEVTFYYYFPASLTTDMYGIPILTKLSMLNICAKCFQIYTLTILSVLECHRYASITLSEILVKEFANNIMIFIDWCG